MVRHREQMGGGENDQICSFGTELTKLNLLTNGNDVKRLTLFPIANYLPLRSTYLLQELEFKLTNGSG